MDKQLAFNKETGHDPFLIAPQLQKAFEDFVTASTTTPRSIHEWMQPYLNWRWQVRNQFDSLGHVRKAPREARSILLKYNDILCSDAKLLSETSGSVAAKLLRLFPFGLPMINLNQAAFALLDPEAATVLKTAQSAPTVPTTLATFFDGFVHDSLAGFDRRAVEMTGYWRYRKGFRGDDTARIVSNEESEAAGKVA